MLCLLGSPKREVDGRLLDARRLLRFVCSLPLLGVTCKFGSAQTVKPKYLFETSSLFSLGALVWVDLVRPNPPDMCRP